jgi:hypothetical protein
MNENMIKDVMEDVLQELKEANGVLSGLRSSVDALEGRVAGFEQLLKDQQVIVQPPDLGPAFGEIRQLTRETGVAVSETIDSMQKGEREILDLVRVTVAQKLSEMQAVIDGRLAEQPKPVIRQWRVSLFPESDRAGSYKYFINWLFGGTALVLLVCTIFLLGRQYLDKWHPSPGEPRPAMSMEEVVARRDVKAAVPVVVRHQGAMMREARRWGDSVARTKRLEKIIDTLHNVLIQYLADSLRENRINQPQKKSGNAVTFDSFMVIKQ